MEKNNGHFYVQYKLFLCDVLWSASSLFNYSSALEWDLLKSICSNFHIHILLQLLEQYLLQ